MFMYSYPTVTWETEFVQTTSGKMHQQDMDITFSLITLK